MSLHVASFGGGIVVAGSGDSQRTDELQVADSVDIGQRGGLVVTTDATDYLELDDDAAVAWTRLWALLECAGFNFSKVVAVGEGGNGGTPHYLMTSFNREGVATPLAWSPGGSIFGQGINLSPILPPLVMGVQVTGADFAGIFPIRFAAEGGAPANPAQNIRLYLINIGAREGFAPNIAPGLYMIAVTPPDVIPVANQIGRFDALGTGGSGLFTVPAGFGNGEGEGQAVGGTKARQLYFRGIIAYNNFVFGWGYDASDEQVGVISAITNANPGKVTIVNHTWATGDRVTIKGVNGMTQVNIPTAYTITVVDASNFTIGVDTTGFGAYVSNGVAVKGNGDGPARVMFSNLGRPLKWGNDNIALSGVDRLFTDSDAIVLGDAGEIVRGAIKWGEKLYFGTNKGLHFISGYGRDSFVTDGSTPVMRAFNVVGPFAMIEGPDKHLYGVCDQGLWKMTVTSQYQVPVPPAPIFQQLRDFNGKSNGYWDQIWTDVTRSANAYPGQTNQDLVWMAVDWERRQVVVGIPWCSVANGFGFGNDTIILKYHVDTGGYTRQQFIGVQYTAAGYFRAAAQQAACRFLGTPTAGKKTVQRYGYKATNNSSLALPSVLPKKRFGPYEPFGADGAGVVKRLYATISWDPLGTPMQVAGITNANPAVVSTPLPHGLATGQQLDISGAVGMPQINGGPYTITVTTATAFSLNGIDSTAFGVYSGSDSVYVTPPLAWACTLTGDQQAIQGQIDQAVAGFVLASFGLSVRAAAPSNAQEGDLWCDLSQTDPNLGNSAAGAFTLALGGYLMRVRRDNAAVAITGITRANPAVVTAPGHGFSTGQRVSIRNVVGMTQVNNDAGAGPYSKDFSIVKIDVDHFSLVGIDSTGYTAYSSGGQVALAWLLIPGLGGQGNRATVPIPVVRRKSTRYTFDLNATTLARRYQVEGFGLNPGDGEGDA